MSDEPDDEFDEYDPWEEEDPEDKDERSEPMNWPQATTYIAFFIAVMLIWHDCVAY